MDILIATSDKNFMKRNPASEPTTMPGPSVSQFFGSYYTSDKVIPHGLGYTPMFRCFYEPFQDGKVFEVFQDSTNYLPNPINTYGGSQAGPSVLASVSDTDLTLQLYTLDNLLSGVNYPIYPVIYNDYGLSTALPKELSANSDYQLDRILSDFGGNTTNHSVAASTLSGGVYLPKTEILTIPNPLGKKALPTMVFSFNGSAFMPHRYRIYNPGNPVPTGRMSATVGMAVDDTNIYFYFTHYLGVQVNFTMFWTLDEIEPEAILDSDKNAFKNLQVARDFLDLPVSVAAGATFIDEVTFTIAEAANFIEAYAYNTDYAQYFNFTDGQYHNSWRKVNTITGNSSDYFLRSDAGSIENYSIILEFSGNNVTMRLYYRNLSGFTRNFTQHPTGKVPIAFVEYTLPK